MSKGKTASKRPSIDSALYRRVRVKTWRPSTQTERTLTTRWLKFETPAQLIRDVAALVPDGDAFQAGFSNFPKSNMEVCRTHLDISFGYVTARDEARGTTTIAYVDMEEADVPVVVAYLLKVGGFIGMMRCYLPEAVVDGGGEELNVPTISQAALAQMQEIAGVM